MIDYCDQCGIAFTYPQLEGTICTSCEEKNQEKDEQEESKDYWKNYQEYLVNLA